MLQKAPSIDLPCKIGLHPGETGRFPDYSDVPHCTEEGIFENSSVVRWNGKAKEAFGQYTNQVTNLRPLLSCRIRDTGFGSHELNKVGYNVLSRK